MLIALLLVASYLEQCSTLNTSVALVNTTDGMVRGQVRNSVEGLSVQEFLGIPFAQPPVDALRFVNPVPVKPWPDIYNATKYGNSCYQVVYQNVGPKSEDCLYLNVWTPQPRPRNATVMVWIHGGGFAVGSASQSIYDGKILVSRNDIILVSMNYRLGAFGFLATGDGRIKGNFGLMDQVLVLQWIQRNIASFGGNPDSVTIFGLSAGAASVGYHIVSLASRSLFKRAIMQSGSPTSTWALLTPESTHERSRRFLKSVGCSDDEFVLHCLQNRSISADIIIKQGVQGMRVLLDSWRPTADHMADRPSTHLSQYNMKKTELLLGTNKDEGSLFLALAGLMSITTISDLTAGLNTAYVDVPLEVGQIILHKYSRNLNTSDPSAALTTLIEIVGDRSFVCPVVNFADANVALGMQTYLYSLDYRASKQTLPEWMGVIHSAELQWVFGIPMKTYGRYTDEEVLLSERIMAYWTNFAKYGDPNGNKTGRTELPEWPQYNHAHEYLSINGGRSLSGRPLLKRCICKLWKIIDSLHHL